MKFPDGAYLIKNFLSLDEQVELTLKVINEYVKPPYRTNVQDAY